MCVCVLYVHVKSCSIAEKTELVILPLYADLHIKMKNPVFNSGGLIMLGQERGQDPNKSQKTLEKY